MGRPLKIIIVGLPLFAERLAKSLKEFDPSNNYISLNTYYKRWDKIRAKFLIPRADLLFSINGTILPSGVFDLAFSKKIPVVMNWVGTDVLLAEKAIESGSFRQNYINQAIHFCEVNWIQEELENSGISAEICNFASFDKKFEAKLPTEKKLNVLSYIPKERSDFYGIEMLLRVAKNLPNIQFLIAGTKAEEYQPLPQNVQALGWVKNMDEVYDRSHVAVRIPEHDGLSTFILESLARGKEVIYKYSFDYCFKCTNEDELTRRLKELEDAFILHTNWDIRKGRPTVVSCDETLENKFYSEKFHKGFTGTVGGFYGPQGRIVRLNIQDPELNHKMDTFNYKGTCITNLEMETAAIYGLGKLLGHNCLSLNAIIANRAVGEFSSNPEKTVNELIAYTLDKLVE
jgi:hypothetical protein